MPSDPPTQTGAARALAVSVGSGVISGLVLPASGGIEIGLYLPGVVFGLMTGLVLGRPGWRLALWCAASALAWYAAIIVFIAQLSDSFDLFSQETEPLSEEVLPWLAAGTTGAALLVVGRWAIYRRTPQWQPWLTVVAGAALAVVMAAISRAAEDVEGVGEVAVGVVLFAVWQGGVGWLLLQPSAAPVAEPVSG